MSATPTVLDVSCSWCGAQPGEQCTSLPSGTARVQPHQRRWINISTAMVDFTEFIVEILETDHQLGLTAGEEYAAIRYWVDPASKVTLLRRIPDGHNPECTQYHGTVKFVRWAEHQ